jgi:hypothetical protein
LSSPADDSFALHHEERLARTEAALSLLSQREEVRARLVSLTQTSAEELEIPYPAEGSDAFVDTLEQLFETTLADQGNRFAEAVRSQSGGDIRQDLWTAANALITRNAGLLTGIGVSRDPLVELATEVATTAFLLGGPLRAYLRELADAYTLLAFMQEAPDVQEAVGQFFSRGRLLLDTTVLLPCFGELLLDEDAQRYTNLLRGAREAGMSLSVTAGVLHEISTHLDVALARHRRGPSEWIGEAPRVYADWLTLTGGGDFPAFIDQFRGTGGEEDIALFLDQALGCGIIDPALAVETIPGDQRHRVAEIWRPRKRMSPTGTEMDRDIRLGTDIEMYFAVLGWREGERRDMFGYEAWWVTDDRVAHRMRDLARAEAIELRSNPCMSPTFLVNLLTIGPSRRKLGRTLRDQLPVALDLQRGGLGVPGLSQLADEIREAHATEPEWLLRRRIRDRMNAIKEMREPLDDAVTDGADGLQ